MYQFARVYWTIYYKDSKEIGSSSYLDNSEKLYNQLNLLRLWQKQNNCRINIDVIFYPDSIFKDTLTIMGAI